MQPNDSAPRKMGFALMQPGRDLNATKQPVAPPRIQDVAFFGQPYAQLRKRQQTQVERSEGMSQTYLETVSQAAERLEMAKSALSRDLAQAADIAGWGGFLRDKYDVAELVRRIGEQLGNHLFLTELHAAADKVRDLQPKVGRPPKVKQAGQNPDEAQG